MYKRYEEGLKGLFTSLIPDSKPNNQDLISKYKEEAEKQGMVFLVRIKNGHGFYMRKDCGHCFEYQITAVRNSFLAGSNVRCAVCLANYKNKICSEKGVVEMSKGGRGGLYNFRRIACGHEISATYFQIARTESCAACKSQEIEQIALQKNLKVIGRHDKASINVYQLPCGHTKAIDPNSVRNDGWRCTECYEDKIKAAMDEWGYEYIGFSEKSPHYRLAKFKACGHEKDVLVYDLIGRPVKGFCKICIEEKHNKEATENDLTILGAASNGDPNYRKYKLHCCGGTGDLMVTHVRRSNFICPCCGDSSYSNPSNLYLLLITSDNNRWLKFGFSKDVDYRISCYGLTNCEAEVLKIVPISTGRIAIRVEKGIHKKLKQLKIDNEYTKPYFSVSGFTECYPYSALTIITKEMENYIGK